VFFPQMGSVSLPLEFGNWYGPLGTRRAGDIDAAIVTRSRNIVQQFVLSRMAKTIQFKTRPNATGLVCSIESRKWFMFFRFLRQGRLNCRSRGRTPSPLGIFAPLEIFLGTEGLYKPSGRSLICHLMRFNLHSV